MKEEISKAEKQFIEALISSVTSKLTGSSDRFERLILPNYPQKLLILGSLSEEDPNFADTESTSVKSNSLTVMFLSKGKIKVKVKPRLNIYYGVKEKDDELDKHGLKRDKRIKIPFVWKRLKTNFPYYELNEENKKIILDFNEYVSQINQDDEHSNFYERKKPNYKWQGQIEIEIEDDPSIDGKLIKIRLINKTRPDKDEKPKYDPSFFDCGLELELGNLKITDFIDKKKNDFGTTKELKSRFKTFNCDYEYDEKQNILKTIPFKRTDQPKLKPRSNFKFNDEIIQPLFSSLSESTDILNQLYKRLEEYLALYKKNPKFEYDNDFTKITLCYQKVISRFKEGIVCLESNPKAKKAFQLMQRTFDRYTKKERYHGWRIFQIVFIVSLIPDIIDLKHSRRKEVDLLHVNTGGGKSEAYFGLVIFSAFHDRLIGKRFGTTAITKFPLRMLSVDQLQRISNIFILAEEVRKKEINKSEDHPFSVAYFVGSSDEFPRKTKQIIDKIKENMKKGLTTEGKIINKCPLCEGTIFLKCDKNHKILHYCGDCKSEYNLFFTDEEIYRFLPTFIISTVDKLAGIASQRRFRNILGGKLNSCSKGHGFIPRGDSCEVDLDHETCKDDGKELNIGFSTAPSIIIQDEMHLIREGFGTIDSHFETFIESLNEEINGFKFKNITMTATVKGAKEQNKSIYWKKETNIFPWYSPIERGHEDPFYELESNKSQRIILGLKPNFRDNQYASLLTLRYIAEFIAYVEKKIDEFAESYHVTSKELKAIIVKYKCLMTYHNKKSDVNSMNFYINSVVNSKLDSIDYSVTHNILTGNNTLDEIKEQIEQIKKFERNQNKISALSCTSIVSHGIDISRWNLMCFQGVPGSTAEYIQALSRVGRMDTGIIFLWFYPNRVRDISFYNNFKEYHKDIDLFVECVPIERWTKLGFQQTFHSLFCGAILNYMSNRLEKPIYNLKQIQSVFFTSNIDENTRREQELVDFLKNAYHVTEGMPNSNFMKDEIARGVRDRLIYLHKYAENPSNNEKEFFPNALDKNDNKYWRTQSGMRGIQDTVGLINYESNFIRRYKNE